MDSASRDVPRRPCRLVRAESRCADTQTRLALTDICAKLRDAKPSDGPFGRYAGSLSVAARAATAAATNFPGPLLRSGRRFKRLRRATDAGWARPVIGVAQAFSDNVQRTQRAVEACELEAAASVCCRRNDDRDAAEDYLASLTARAALVREHGSRHWRLVDGAPLHVLVERCHLTKPGTFRALKNAARLVEAACLLREAAGPPYAASVNGADGERLSETTSQAIPRTG